jgi:hypothetical protein
MGGGAQFGREGEVRELEERNETFPSPWYEESIGGNHLSDAPILHQVDWICKHWPTSHS